MKRLRVAITGFTGCFGCQLSIINCEDEILKLTENIDFAFFPIAGISSDDGLPFDAAFVEGAVSENTELSFLKMLRERSKILVSIGSCSENGGISSLGYDSESLTSPKPVSSIVQTDFSIHGCPPEKSDILRVFSEIADGLIPLKFDFPVCPECRMNENCCLLTEKGEPCMGSITRGGCSARCPSLSVPCEGCRGAVEESDLELFARCAQKFGIERNTIIERYSRFNNKTQTSDLKGESS